MMGVLSFVVDRFGECLVTVTDAFIMRDVRCVERTVRCFDDASEEGIIVPGIIKPPVRG